MATKKVLSKINDWDWQAGAHVTMLVGVGLLLCAVFVMALAGGCWEVSGPMTIGLGMVGAIAILAHRWRVTDGDAEGA